MSSTKPVHKYIWLLGMIISKGERGMVLEDILSSWEDHFGTPYSRRSFNNHRETINDLFGIEIKCRRTNNTYYVPYASEAVDLPQTSKWIIDTFTVNNMLSLSKERLSGRVSVEEIPSGHQYLTPIIGAMQQNHELCISYEKYDGLSEEELHIQPYAVKEFAKRWYVVAFCRERNALRVYGLDRILSLDVLDQVFTLPEGFNVDELFADSFGIYLPEGKKAIIVKIKTTQKEARYLRDLPLHHSQVELEQTSDGFVLFALRVIPNDNLIMELCKRGPRIEVISPVEVRNAVAESLSKAAAMYTSEK